MKKPYPLLLLLLLSHPLLAFTTHRYDLNDILSKEGVDTNKIGCKCIMTATTAEHTDSTMCMCFNRNDGTINDTTKCRAYTGTLIYTCLNKPFAYYVITDSVFGFYSDVTANTNLWQECVKHYCPCNGDKPTKPPTNKVYF
jgi:hypothetical protein